MTFSANRVHRLFVTATSACESWAPPMRRIIAITTGLTLVSGNTRHFGRIPGLQFENWLEG